MSSRTAAATLSAVLATLGLLACQQTGGGTPTASAVTTAVATSVASPAAKAVATPAASPAATAPAKAQSTGGKPVRLTLDGQEVDVQGDSGKAERVAGQPMLVVVSGNSMGSRDTGYGVNLQLGQNALDKGGLQEGFPATDVDVVTLTVYKGREFSYTSAGRLPNQAVPGLKLDQTSGRLKGSYESNISGVMGKFKARVEFDVPFPK